MINKGQEFFLSYNHPLTTKNHGSKYSKYRHKTFIYRPCEGCNVTLLNQAQERHFTIFPGIKIDRTGGGENNWYTRLDFPNEDNKKDFEDALRNNDVKLAIDILDKILLINKNDSVVDEIKVFMTEFLQHKNDKHSSSGIRMETPSNVTITINNEAAPQSNPDMPKPSKP